MNAIIGLVIVILVIVIAVKLLGLALKVAGILIFVPLAVGVYLFAQRLLKGPNRA